MYRICASALLSSWQMYFCLLVTLPPGESVILTEAFNGGGLTGFRCRLQDPTTGAPILPPTITVSAKPKAAANLPPVYVTRIFSSNKYRIGSAPITVTGSNMMVPLEQIATVTMGKAPSQIQHEDTKRTITVAANAQGRSPGEVTADARRIAREMQFPPGYGLELAGASRDDLVSGLKMRGHKSVMPMESPQRLASLVAGLAKPGDYVICLGAGTITQWAYALPGELEALARGGACSTTSRR